MNKLHLIAFMLVTSSIFAMDPTLADLKQKLDNAQKAFNSAAPAQKGAAGRALKAAQDAYNQAGGSRTTTTIPSGGGTTTTIPAGGTTTPIVPAGGGQAAAPGRISQERAKLVQEIAEARKAIAKSVGNEGRTLQPAEKDAYYAQYDGVFASIGDLR